MESIAPSIVRYVDYIFKLVTEVLVFNAYEIVYD